MAKEIIMPALGMAQETGQLIRWLKREGETVTKGEPIMEIETDKATVEIEAPASGTLSQVTAQEGDVIPVGQIIAFILPPGEREQKPPKENKSSREVVVSPVARKIAEEHHVDLAQVPSSEGRITKEDVLAYLEQSGQVGASNKPGSAVSKQPIPETEIAPVVDKVPASPKARRLAQEQHIELSGISGSGPGGAVLTQDVLQAVHLPEPDLPAAKQAEPAFARETAEVENPSPTWRAMVERMSASWTSAPHFYLIREVHASQLVELRSRLTPVIEKRGGVKPTYTDLLVKLVAVTLRDHPEMNTSWTGEGIQRHTEINMGLAVGINDGLVVPVIPQADGLSIGQIAARRQDVVERANQHKLRPADLSNSTFTLTNLGMYNVDAFLAVLNPPQAAILAVGRIAERVVVENHQPVVRPMLVLSLSCDHRVVDGMRAAMFMDDFVALIEEPWGLFV